MAYMPYMAFVKLVLIEGEPWQKMTTMMTGHTYGYLGCGHLVSNWFRSAAAEVSLENKRRQDLGLFLRRFSNANLYKTMPSFTFDDSTFQFCFGLRLYWVTNWN